MRKNLQLLLTAASKQHVGTKDMQQIFLYDKFDKSQYFKRELPSRVDVVDRLRFILTGAFVNTGAMVGTLIVEEASPLSEQDKAKLARTVYLWDIGGSYEDPDQRTVAEALCQLGMSGDITTKFDEDEEPMHFDVTLHARGAGFNAYNRTTGRGVVRNPVIKSISNEVQLFCQLFHLSHSRDGVTIRDDYRDVIVLGRFQRERILSWRLQRPMGISSKYDKIVRPSFEYSHMSYMSDFDLDINGRRYASVCSVMGGDDESKVKATGITLLPSELFARVALDLVFCPRNATRRLMLHPSKACATRVGRMVFREVSDLEESSLDYDSGEDEDGGFYSDSWDEYSESNQSEREREALDEYTFDRENRLTVQDMASINWARNAVSLSNVHLVHEILCMLG